MNLSWLPDDIDDSKFSILAVSGSQSVFGLSDAARPGVTVEWAGDLQAVGRQLSAGSSYNMVVVDADNGTPQMTSAVIAASRNRIGTRVVVAGSNLYGIEHLRAVINGADGYVPRGVGWRYRIQGIRPARPPEEQFVDVLVNLTDGHLRPNAARALFRELRTTLNTKAEGELSVPQAVEMAISHTRQEIPIQARPGIITGITRLLHRTATSTGGRVVIDSQHLDDPFDQSESVKRDLTDDTSDKQRSGDLRWNTKFPENPEILGGTPHRVPVGRNRVVETRLAAGDDANAVSSIIAGREIVGKEIVFQFTATNGEVRVEGGRWSPRAASALMTCTRTGTEPYRAVFRATAVGEARLTVYLIVNNGVIAEQTVDFVVEPIGVQTSTAAVSTAPRVSSHVVAGALTEAPGAKYRLELTSDLGMLEQDTRVTDWVGLRGVGATRFGAPPAVFSAQIASRLSEHYESLRRLSERTVPLRSNEFEIPKANTVALEFAQIGAALHNFLFHTWPDGSRAPAEMEKIGRRLEAAGSPGIQDQLQIVAAEFAIPWGIVYDRHIKGQIPQNVNEVDLEGFWGVRFDMFRSVRSANCAPRRGARRLIKPVIGASVPNGDDQVAFITELGQRPDQAHLRVDPPARTPDEVQSWAESGDESDLLYLFCHARPSAESTYIGFAAAEDSDERVTIEQLAEWWGKSRSRNPVVVLNACASGHNDLVLGAPFVQFFLGYWNAQVFVGTDWPVGSVMADAIGRRLIQQLLAEGSSIRSALRSVIAEGIAKTNLFPLMYAVYGPNNVQFVDPS